MINFEELELVAAVDVSPSGNFLSIIQKLTVGNQNLKIYNIPNNSDIIFQKLNDLKFYIPKMINLYFFILKQILKYMIILKS